MHRSFGEFPMNAWLRNRQLQCICGELEVGRAMVSHAAVPGYNQGALIL